MNEFHKEQLNETLLYINNLLTENKDNLEIKETLLEVKEKLLNNKFDKEKFIDDIDGFLSLKK